MAGRERVKGEWVGFAGLVALCLGTGLGWFFLLSCCRPLRGRNVPRHRIEPQAGGAIEAGKAGAVARHGKLEQAALGAEIEELAAGLVALAEELVREANGAAISLHDFVQRALLEGRDEGRNKHIPLREEKAQILFDPGPVAFRGTARELHAYAAGVVQQKAVAEAPKRGAIRKPLQNAGLAKKFRVGLERPVAAHIIADVVDFALQMLAIEDEAIVHAILDDSHAFAVGCFRAGFVCTELEAADHLLERGAIRQRFHHMRQEVQMIGHDLVVAKLDLRIIVWNAPQFLVHKFAHRGELERGLGDVAEPDAGGGFEREHGNTRAVVIIVAGGPVHGFF